MMEGNFRLRRLHVPRGDVQILDSFFCTEDAAAIFSSLFLTTGWRHDVITIFGRTVPLPRLTAWHGDADALYTYSNITMSPSPWTSALLDVKRRIERVVAVEFNSVLANLYRDGCDHMSWHADDETELGPEPVIASVSFGAARRFVFKPKDKADQTRVEVELGDGSLLLMRGATQRFWVHSVPKARRIASPRINLTFRTILNERPDTSTKR